MKSAKPAVPAGFIAVNKPGGITSSEAVEKIRRILKARAGHGGTLDPSAEGVLVVGLLEARKFLSYLEDEKEYEGLMHLGRESSTGDAEGDLSPERCIDVADEAVTAAVARLTGSLDLPVPAYSAVKLGGRRLYEMARSGEAVTPPVRKMCVKSLEVSEIRSPVVRFRMTCAAGTYVRSVVSEWGRILGCGAYLEKLVRTRSGVFTLADARTLETIEEAARNGRAGELLIPVFDALSHLPAVILSEDDAELIRNGRETQVPSFSCAPGPVRLVLAGGGMLGMGRIAASETGRPERLLPVRLISGDLRSI